MGHLDNMNAALPSYGDLKAEVARLKEQLGREWPAIEELTKEREMYRMRWLGSMTTRDAELIRAENKQLRAAAERVCWFDWSHNDEDAARAVDDLRKLVSTGEQLGDAK